MCSLELPDYEGSDFRAAAGGAWHPLALNIPQFDETARTLALFFDTTGLGYPMVDHQGTAFLFAKPPGISPYPYDVLIGPDGRVIDIETRYHRRLLLLALAEAQAP